MLPVALSPGFGQALLATLFYALPALFVTMMVGGLANPAAETWGAPERALRWKETYRRYAGWGRWWNRWLFGLFLVQLVSLFALRNAECDTGASHLSAAAWNLARVVDLVFFVSLAVAVVFAVAGLVWAVRYALVARSEGWPDPRRRDAIVVHGALVPFSLLLMGVAFGVVPQMMCPFVLP